MKPNIQYPKKLLTTKSNNYLPIILCAAVTTLFGSSKAPPPIYDPSVPKIIACHGWLPYCAWPGCGVVVGVGGT